MFGDESRWYVDSLTPLGLVPPGVVYERLQDRHLGKTLRQSQCLLQTDRLRRLSAAPVGRFGRRAAIVAVTRFGA